jgi:hypothetical protein
MIDICSILGISIRSSKEEKKFWIYKKEIARLRREKKKLKLEERKKEVRKFLDQNGKFYIKV